MLFLSVERFKTSNKISTYTLWDRRTEENVLPLRPNRIFGDGVPLAFNKRNLYLGISEVRIQF